MGEDFTCAQCGGTFEKAWSDEEAAAEYQENMPAAAATKMATSFVCDDCYNEMLPRLRGMDGELQ